MASKLASFTAGHPDELGFYFFPDDGDVVCGAGMATGFGLATPAGFPGFAPLSTAFVGAEVKGIGTGIG